MTPELVEQYGLQDVFCSGLARVEGLGSCRRLVFYSDAPAAPGGPERTVVAKLVLSAENLAAIAQALFADQAEPAAVIRPVSAIAH